jgi:hypothetical protein
MSKTLDSFEMITTGVLMGLHERLKRDVSVLLFKGASLPQCWAQRPFGLRAVRWKAFRFILDHGQMLSFWTGLRRTSAVLNFLGECLKECNDILDYVDTRLSKNSFRCSQLSHRMSFDYQALKSTYHGCSSAFDDLSSDREWLSLHSASHANRSFWVDVHLCWIDAHLCRHINIFWWVDKHWW